MVFFLQTACALSELFCFSKDEQFNHSINQFLKFQPGKSIDFCDTETFFRNGETRNHPCLYVVFEVVMLKGVGGFLSESFYTSADFYGRVMRRGEI